VSDLQDEAREHLRAQYARVFTEEAIGRHLDDFVGEHQARELLDWFVRRRPDARTVLDVGSGYGSFVLLARERGLDARGVELAPFEVDWARRRLAERRPPDDPVAVYAAGDGARLPYPDASFDAVTLWNVLEHVPDLRATVDEAARVVRPGGSVVALAPNYASFRREAHYHVPWAPFLPKTLALPYLRALGRDPSFFRDDVHPITKRRAIRAFLRAGLVLREPRLEKLADSAAVGNPRLRRALEATGRARLTPALTAAVRLASRNPLSPTILLEGVRP
jgi:SAM-dependent methyltransferase